MNATTTIGENIMDAIKKFLVNLSKVIHDYKVYKAGKVK